MLTKKVNWQNWQICWIPFPSCKIGSLSSPTLPNCWFFLKTRHVRTSHKCSNIFKSGEPAGYSKQSILLAWNHDFVSLLTWIRALSCWKTSCILPTKESNCSPAHGSNPYNLFWSLQTATPSIQALKRNKKSTVILRKFNLSHNFCCNERIKFSEHSFVLK